MLWSKPAVGMVDFANTAGTGVGEVEIHMYLGKQKFAYFVLLNVLGKT